MFTTPTLKDKLDQFFAHRSPAAIAKDLIGRTMYYHGSQGTLAGYIVEDEAYGGANDSTSYAYKNHVTKSSKPLYGLPGTMYIYKIHAREVFGIVDQPKGQPSGIMIRAIEPARGKYFMVRNRKQRGVNITNGPAKLMQAFGITNNRYSLTLCNNGPLGIDLDHKRTAKRIIRSARIGVSKGPNQGDQLRFYVQGNPYVSQMSKRDVLPNNGWKIN
ncbi:DNA-3-methyladenine glycosylase [Acetilactobacillus jinshanensis]|uniref:DNA-3-methyladenine glycosylase n=1 Tax=Acetilactobacillus jinshanensis TaxID=1720083 RepID=UPI0013A63737|nr:DNA-3-methyladenine glycosylase [Acetilactobacillus jinshanensis]